MIPGIVASAQISSGGDPYWSYVVSLLHFNGVNGSTSITDETGRPWTASGNAHITTAQYRFGGASAEFDGYRDVISTSSLSDMAFGSGDFTIEMQFKLASLPATDRYPCLISSRASLSSGFSFDLVVSPGGSSMIFEMSGNGSSAQRTITATKQLDTTVFHHVAISRFGDQAAIFIDGELLGSADVSGFALYAPTSPISFGRLTEDFNPDLNYFNGWIDEARITKGVGRYSSNFTPPTAEFPNN